MPPRDGWGGPRPGSGRPPTGKAFRSLTVRLPAEDIERLRELGDGNASAGVRRLLEQTERDNRRYRTALEWIADAPANPDQYTRDLARQALGHER